MVLIGILLITKINSYTSNAGDADRLSLLSGIGVDEKYIPLNYGI